VQGTNIGTSESSGNGPVEQGQATQSQMTQHPLSAAFPPLPFSELEELSESIRLNGLRNPGTLLAGQVLDGWHRYQACEMAGVEFIATEFTGDDPVAFVIDCNLHRRQLTASQRSQAIVKVMEWKPTGRPTSTVDSEDVRRKGGNIATFSNAELADLANVSPRTIRHAKAAHEAGLGDAVIAGEMSASAAAKKASSKPEEEEEEKPHIKIHQSNQKEFNKLEARALELQQINDVLNQRVEELESILSATAEDWLISVVLSATNKARRPLSNAPLIISIAMRVFPDPVGAIKH